MAWVETLTAAADTEVADSGIAQDDQANPSVTLTTGASQETYVASVLMSGAGTQGAITAPTSPAGTKLDNHDFGQQVGVLGELDANDAGGGVTFTWTAGSDDVAMIAAAIAEVAGGGAALTKDLADTVTLSDAIVKAPKLGKADTVTLSDAIAKAMGLNKADIATLSDAVSKKPGKFVADTVTLSEGFNALKILALFLADTVTLSDSITRKAMGLGKADTVTLSDSAGKSVAISKSDTVTLTDAISKKPGKALADTVTLSDNVGKGIGKALADTVTTADAIVKAISKLAQDVVTLIDVIDFGGVTPPPTIIRLTWKATKGWMHRTTHRRIDPDGRT